MSHSSRGKKRVNGPTTLIESGEGGESQTTSGAYSQPGQSETRQPGEGDHKRGGITMPHSLLGYQSRSPVFRTLSRSSSGYFSFDYDSVPSSPLMTHNKSTQTPSPSSQVITHAQRRMPHVHENLQDNETAQIPHRPFRPRSLSMPADMRPEVWVAQELRRIGDELNRLYTQGGGRNGRAALAGGRVNNEPALRLWLSILVGRLLQLIQRWR
ncbi:bcl-2-like protein 11 [Megalops cyprinoides]|uniref:bcl-2-like protein 11 n=1 Tax=Megalops cyprinoides TaxID=118141 RepID=UPI001864339D|nr:bcl-2-like protein 11 [Megalops cyprinoides]